MYAYSLIWLLEWSILLMFLVSVFSFVHFELIIVFLNWIWILVVALRPWMD